MTAAGSMFYGCRSITAIHMYGMKVDLDIRQTGVNGSAIDEVFTNLATVSTPTTITLPYDATGYDTSIATAKGWTVDGHLPTTLPATIAQ